MKYVKIDTLENSKDMLGTRVSAQTRFITYRVPRLKLGTPVSTNTYPGNRVAGTPVIGFRFSFFSQNLQPKTGFALLYWAHFVISIAQ